jgi:two-component system sensor kinase FixL
MSWVTIMWAMLVASCLVLALPHLLVGIWQRRGAHLFFVLAAAAVIGIAVGEFLTMRADSVEQFVRALRWLQLPVFLLVVALVGFVRLYLGTGRLWLGVSACVMRFVCLIVNFAVTPSLSYRQITGLRQLHFLGENVSAAVGVISPRIYLAEFSSVLLLLFLADASIGLWRQGTREKRRRALVVGGSATFFVLLAAGMAAITQHQMINAPYVVSFPFTAILFAMAFELGSDLFN